MIHLCHILNSNYYIIGLIVCLEYVLSNLDEFRLNQIQKLLF